MRQQSSIFMDALHCFKQQVAVVMAATARIAAALQIDPLYSLGSADVNSHWVMRVCPKWYLDRSAVCAGLTVT